MKRVASISRRTIIGQKDVELFLAKAGSLDILLLFGYWVLPIISI